MRMVLSMYRSHGDAPLAQVGVALLTMGVGR
jgi:hypothetical protein